MTPTAVIPGVSATSIACLRSLGRHGVRTVAVSEHERAPTFSSRFCDESVVVPSPREDLEAYTEGLLTIARRNDVRTITPTSDADIYALAKNRDQFEEHIAPVWPPFDTVRSVQDRVRLMEIAEEAGVVVPETQLLEEVDDWDQKLVVKSRYSPLTDEYVDTVSSPRAIDPGRTRYLQPGVEPDKEALYAGMMHEPIVQEYIPGTEYAFWALYDQGEPVATCQRTRIRGYQYAGNASIYRETVREPELEATGRALLDSLDWHGVAAVQVMKDDSTGEYTLMEINPRFWLSLQAAVRAGADFPYYYWQVANGVRPSIDAEYEEGVATHLILGELSYLHSVLRRDYSYVPKPTVRAALRDVATSLVADPHFDFLDPEDPAPFVRNLLNAMTDTLTSNDDITPREEGDGHADRLAVSPIDAADGDREEGDPTELAS